MPINFKLGDRRPPVEAQFKDPMSRARVGWEPGLADQQTYEDNRGIWMLGRRAHKERVATFSHNGAVVTVVEIEGIENYPSIDGLHTRQAIIGRVLSPGDRDYDALIGHPVDGFRNPVTYTEHPEEMARTCACGCDGEVTGERVFLPGHDQRAIHERIAQKWGTTLEFIEWFDANYGTPSVASAHAE